ncbi:MAG: CoA pyrophosphatase [Alphaproteobacteria bacterium]|nr:CoA pyrophosphatase [Alphaproteobacteria bacterium]
MRDRITRRLRAIAKEADSPATFTPASVLLPIVAWPEGMTMLFTRRSDELKSHAGQIAFPGGRRDPGDADAVATALREANEEIGLGPERVEIVGRLPVYNTGTGFSITPIVGFVAPPVTLVPDPREVAEVFEVPLDFLLDPANHRRDSMIWRGEVHWYDAVPYNGRYIWGATAGMMVRFAKLLADA